MSVAIDESVESISRIDKHVDKNNKNLANLNKKLDK